MSLRLGRWWAGFALDPRSLASFRIAIGSLILIDLVLRSGDLSAFYTDVGVLPRTVWIEDIAGTWAASLHLLSGSWGGQVILFCIAGAFAAMLVAGYRTKLAMAVSWLLLTSLHSRNPAILNGGDSYLRMLAFWGIFLPLGKKWSVDEWLSRPSFGQDAETAKVYTGARFITGLGTVAIYVQMAVMYVSTGLLKAEQAAWTSGGAVQIALSKAHLVTPLGRWLLDYPLLLRALSHATLWLEIGGPLVLIASRGWLRVAAVFSFIAFHVGLAMCLSIGLFAYICIAGMLPFLPATFWDWVCDRAGARLTASKPHRTHGRERAAIAPRPADRRERLWLSRVSYAISGLIIVLALTITIGSSLGQVFAKRNVLPTALRNVGVTCRWNQSWSMFVAVEPDEVQSWFVIHAKLKNGQSVNSMTGQTPVSYDEPESVEATFGNARWRKLWYNLLAKRYQPLRAPVGRYFREAWNASHRDAEQIERLRIYHVKYRAQAKADLPKQSFVTVFGQRYETTSLLTTRRLYQWTAPKPEVSAEAQGSAIVSEASTSASTE